MLSLILEQLTQILAKVGISSSQEDEILIAVKDVNTPPDTNKEESTFEESLTSDEEHLFKLEIEEDEEGISDDHYANESCIKQCFQVSIRLDQFCFCFYFDLHLQSLISHTLKYIRFHFVKSYVNNILLLLHVWFHWKFHYT